MDQARFEGLLRVATNYGGHAEMLKGDSAVGLTSSQWPGAFRAHHQELKANHKQALVDPALQQAVLQVIRAQQVEAC